jgi:DNA-binding winged helix-turn-helix (wHTH) protein
LEQRHGRPRAVVLEDEADIGDLVQRWLAQHGMEAVPTGTAPHWEALPSAGGAADMPRPRTGFAPAVDSLEVDGHTEPWVPDEDPMDAPSDPSTDRHIRLGPLDIDQARRTVHISGVEAHLTPTEFRLLRHLAEHPDRLVGHRELLARVWGPGYEDDVHLLQVTMRSLRGKLALIVDRPITETVYGAGYRMAELEGLSHAKRSAAVAAPSSRRASSAP